MKARIMMIIMAVALVALPTMAQQEWQSTSAMQGSGSAYSAQVTAVGATGVTDMASTTTSTPNNGPRRAKKEGDFGPGGQNGGDQDPNSPVGDAWPLALFAALFAIVITIKKRKNVMKKNVKTMLLAAVLMMSISVWADSHTMPAGTYYFDFRACTGENAANLVEIFNGLESKATISLVSTATCSRNTGVTQNSGTKKQFSNSGTFSVFCVTLSGTDDQRTTDQSGFIQYSWNNGSNWKGWDNYTNPSPVSGETDVFWCVVNYSGNKCTYSWNTGSLPSDICDDIITLTFAAGPNGSITTKTVNGETATSGLPYDSGSIVELTATPTTPGYVFSCWTNASSEVVSTSATYSFTLTSSVNLTANFVIEGTDSPISGCTGCFRVAP